MNLAALGKDNVRTFGECPALAFEGRQLTAPPIDWPTRCAGSARVRATGSSSCSRTARRWCRCTRRPPARGNRWLPLYSMLGDALRDVLDPRLRGS